MAPDVDRRQTSGAFFLYNGAMHESEKIRVAVLRGGPSSEYEVSLKTGAAALAHIPRERFEPFDVFIDRAGVWYENGLARRPEVILRNAGVAFNALHGEWGEDGGVQEILDAFGARYTGSGRFASRLAMQKSFAKSVLEKYGVKTPVWRVLYRGDTVGDSAVALHRSFPQPSVIKPVGLGSSVGVSIVRTVQEIADALERAFAVSDTALVEEYIVGKEATVGVVEGFRGQELYSLLPIEIVPAEGSQFFDYDAKYGGQSQEICPGRFTAEESAELQKVAAHVHRTLGLRHYSRSDFILHQRRGMYFLEVNTLPGLTPESLLPKSLTAVGSSLSEFLEHVLDLAVAGK
ncbi:MAG: D-alanine-D-alanine ligase [Parcubacteria group bacterium Gr01-1014_17]|nr:MAG: D-alanine-D-alanine ligase [Parcubacteria group bacterium Gr01-1014_17]